MTLKIDEVIIRMARLKLSKTELAKRTGIEYSYLCRMLKSKQGRPETIGKLADGLECDVTEIAIPEIVEP